MQKNKSQSKGFTLVEIMVATSIFMIIMLISLGALITSSDTSRKAQALRSSMDNVSFALESMTRALRTGSNYTCVDSAVFLPDSSLSVSCPIGSSSGGGAIAFTPATNATTPSTPDRTVAYNLSQRADGTYSLQRCTFDSSSPSPYSCLDVVSPEINIKKLRFFVDGTHNSTTNPPDDLIQPNVYIMIKGSVTIKGQETVFAVQTDVSQRSTE